MGASKKNILLLDWPESNTCRGCKSSTHPRCLPKVCNWQWLMKISVEHQRRSPKRSFNPMIGVHPSGSCITLRDHLTLQLMENGLIADVFPIEKWGYSIAMLAYQINLMILEKKYWRNPGFLVELYIVLTISFSCSFRFFSFPNWFYPNDELVKNLKGPLKAAEIFIWWISMVKCSSQKDLP